MHSNGSYKQNEKATHWKGEGICRKYTPNIHGGHTIQQQKKQATRFKNGQRIWIDIFHRRHTNGQQAHDKMLNSTHHQGNGNMNYMIPPHTCQTGY